MYSVAMRARRGTYIEMRIVEQTVRVKRKIMVQITAREKGERHRKDTVV